MTVLERAVPNRSGKKTDMEYTICSVDRALALLEVLAEHPNAGVTEIAELTGNTKSMVFRVLFTLERRGYVRKDPATRTYALGYRTLYLADKAGDQISLIGIAQPHMDQLSKLCNENVHLFVRDGTACVCVAISETPQQLRLSASVGQHSTLHAGSAPKILLAYASDEIQRAVLDSELQAYTPATITDPETLRRLLRKIRKDGVHESRSERDAGAFSIAAPICDYSGEVIAALSIAGPESRLTAGFAKKCRSMVLEFSGAIGTEMGWGSPIRASR